MKIRSIYILSLIVLLAGCAGETYTELQLASARGQADMIAVMLDKGTDVNQANKHGKTPLMLAVGNGRVEATKVLLERNAAIDAKDVDGMTALMMASSNGNADTIKLLVEKNADINVVNRYGATAVTNAAFFNHAASLKELLKSKTPVNTQTAENAMLISSGLGNNEIIKILIDYGVDVNSKGKNDRTPLMAAAEFNHPATIKLLLENKADPTAKDADGDSVMRIAESNGNASVIEMLKNAGG